jgi:uncharacterized protein (TIGR02246 family)
MAFAGADREETQDELERTLLARERARRDALVADDAAAFADLIADDVVHVHTTGIVQDKAALLGHTGSFLRFYEIERGPLKIRRLAPDVAVMTGEMTNLVGRRGTEEKVQVKAFVTQVWARRDGQWRIASFHAVRLPETA